MRAHTSSASAIWGIALGCTKLTASIRRTPVRDNASMSATFASVGTGSSFCRPSRGPTSRSEMASGRSLTMGPPQDGCFEVAVSPHLLPRKRTDLVRRVIGKLAGDEAVDEHTAGPGEGGEPARDVDRFAVHVAEPGQDVAAGETDAQLGGVALVGVRIKQAQRDLSRSRDLVADEEHFVSERLHELTAMFSKQQR